MTWRLYYLVIILPFVCSLDDLTSNKLFEIDSDGEPGGATTEQSLGITTDIDSLLEEEEEGVQNISDIFVENWTDGALKPIYIHSQDNGTELDTDDVEILRFGDVLTSTSNIISTFDQF